MQRTAGTAGTGRWEPTPSGGVLHFTVTKAQACALYWQLNTGVLRTAAYWRRHWAGWALPFAAAGGLWWAAGWLPALTLLVLALGTRVWRMRHPLNLQSLIGAQIVTLTADGLYLTRPGGRLYAPYTAYDTLRTTPDGLLVYNSGSGAALVIPRSAFADAAALAGFTALLRARIGRCAGAIPQGGRL